MQPKCTNDNHDVMNKFNLSSQEDNDLSVRSSKQSFKQEFHETRFKQQQETLQPSRRLIQLVNRDPVFADAKRVLGLFPQVAYKLVKTAGVERARMVTAFVLSLFEAEYFTVDRQGRYDASIPGNQERARNMLQGIIYGKKPIFLSYAGKYFFQQYPEMRELLRQNEQATA